jgi:hypothetical protein
MLSGWVCTRHRFSDLKIIAEKTALQNNALYNYSIKWRKEVSYMP